MYGGFDWWWATPLYKDHWQAWSIEWRAVMEALLDSRQDIYRVSDHTHEVMFMCVSHVRVSSVCLCSHTRGNVHPSSMQLLCYHTSIHASYCCYSTIYPTCLYPASASVLYVYYVYIYVKVRATLRYVINSSQYRDCCINPPPPPCNIFSDFIL